MTSEQQENPSSSKPASGGCGQAMLWASLCGVLSVIIAGVAIVLIQSRLTTEIREFANEVANRIEEVLQVRPEVRVDGVVVVESRSAILEVATAKEEFLARHRWSHSHLFSTKQLEIEARFVARAGFDLIEAPLRVSIDPESGAVRTDLPTPQILSLEMGDIRILRDENGFWNKLTPGDREQAFEALRLQAEEAVANSGILNDARLEAESRIREALNNTKFPDPKGPRL